MSHITATEVAHLATLARLTLTPEETTTYTTHLTGILDYIAILETVDTTSIPDHLLDTTPTDTTRPDHIHPSLPQSTALDNAPQQLNHQFMVPKILE